MGKIIEFFEKKVKLVKHIAFASILLFVLAVALNYYSYLPSFWNIAYLFYFVVFLNTFWLALKIKTIPEKERDNSPAIYMYKYLFLLTLIIFTLNQFLKRQVVSDFMPYLTALSIGLGFLTFYAYKNQTEKEIEKEEQNEKSAETKRYSEFDEKFPRISKIWGLRSIVRWGYKEGWWYVGIFAAIVILGFVLRIWNLNYLQGSDNFNLMSAKALYDNGHFFYARNLQITYCLALLFKIFGATLVVARIPFVILGTFSIFLIYLLGRFINKKIGVICAFLLAISPVAIEKSSFIREYAENFLWGLLLAIILIYVFIKYKDKPKQFFIRYSLIFIISTIFLYIYGNLVGNETLNATLLMIGFLTVPTFLWVIKLNYKKLFLPAVIFSLIGFSIFLSFVSNLSSIFLSTDTWNTYWFKMFFDPMVKFPMQWFSFSTINIIFLVGLFLFSLLIKKNRETIIIFNIVFWSTVVLFMFKFKNTLDYIPTRYLYHIYPFYIAIFSAGLFYFFKGIKKSFSLFVIALVLIFLLSMIIIPQNTIHGAKHDLTIFGPNPDARQLTAIGNRNYYYSLLSFLNNSGLKADDSIVVGEIDPAYITFYFDYSIDSSRYFSYNGIGKYDVGKNMYLQSSYRNIDDLDKAINEKMEGIFFTSHDLQESNFYYNGAKMDYLGIVQGYKFYKWKKEALV